MIFFLYLSSHDRFIKYLTSRDKINRVQIVNVKIVKNAKYVQRKTENKPKKKKKQRSYTLEVK